MNELRKTAQFWADLGIATIPVAYKMKQPKVKWLTYTERLPTNAELDIWYASDISNIGIITGWQGLTIIDFDDMDVFYKWLFWAERFSPTSRKVSQQARLHLSARGAHLYLICPNADNMKLPKIDVLADRKYALIPPSVHPSGAKYQVYRDGLPMFVQSLYDVLPKKLIDKALAQKAPKGNNTTTIPSDPTLTSVDFDPWALAGLGTDPNLVDKIKAQVPITSILSGWIDSGGNGRWKMTKCPFHDDRNPSFWLDTVNQVCGCHAGCTPLPLDVIDLYARLHGISNETAIRELAKRI
jgi:hypothetical protein